MLKRNCFVVQFPVLSSTAALAANRPLAASTAANFRRGIQCNLWWRGTVRKAAGGDPCASSMWPQGICSGGEAWCRRDTARRASGFPSRHRVSSGERPRRESCSMDRRPSAIAHHRDPAACIGAGSSNSKGATTGAPLRLPTSAPCTFWRCLDGGCKIFLENLSTI